MREEADERRLDDFRRSIRGRLRTVCAHLPEAEFAALVEQMARVELRHERRGSIGSSADHPSRPPPRDGGSSERPARAGIDHRPSERSSAREKPA